LAGFRRKVSGSESLAPLLSNEAHGSSPRKFVVRRLFSISSHLRSFITDSFNNTVAVSSARSAEKNLPSDYLIPSVESMPASACNTARVKSFSVPGNRKPPVSFTSGFYPRDPSGTFCLRNHESGHNAVHLLQTGKSAWMPISRGRGRPVDNGCKYFTCIQYLNSLYIFSSKPIASKLVVADVNGRLKKPVVVAT
jgi:hypothetical protein